MGKVAWVSALAGGALAFAIVAPSTSRPSAPIPHEPTADELVAKADAYLATHPVEHTPSPLDEFKATYERFYTAPIEAQVIWMCGLRSSEWSGRIVSNANLFWEQAAERQTPAERMEIARWSKELTDRVQRTMVPGPQKCRDLAASTVPEQLDQVDYDLTGGYH